MLKHQAVNTIKIVTCLIISQHKYYNDYTKFYSIKRKGLNLYEYGTQKSKTKTTAVSGVQSLENYKL